MNIAVIGGGAVGLYLAREFPNVTVFEEDKEIGKPIHCAGVISARGLKSIEVKPKKSVQNKVRGAVLISPGGDRLSAERKATQAYIIDRSKYDNELANGCKSAQIITGKRISTKEELSEYDYIACCEGVHANFTKDLGLKTKNNFVYCYQREGEMKDIDPDYVRMYFGSFAPGFFGWLIPLGDSRVRVGLGASQGNPKLQFTSFTKKYKINGKWDTESGGVIPIGKAIPQTVKDNICIVGDAAGQVKSTTGGGVIFGSLCAKIAAQCMKEGKIENYEKEWRSALGAELRTHTYIRKVLNRISDYGYDRLFRVMKKTGFEDTLESEGDMDFAIQLLKGMTKKPIQTMAILATLPLCFF
jgi:flavin-dependent dehydrogenase